MRSHPFSFLWLSVVRVESGPWDGGTTLCFFFTAMLGIEPGIPMLSLKTPLLSLLLLLLFLFWISISRCLRVLAQSALYRELPPVSAACPSVPHTQQREKQEHKASSYTRVQWAGDETRQGYPQRKFPPVSFKVMEVWGGSLILSESRL